MKQREGGRGRGGGVATGKRGILASRATPRRVPKLHQIAAPNRNCFPVPHSAFVAATSIGRLLRDVSAEWSARRGGGGWRSSWVATLTDEGAARGASRYEIFHAVVTELYDVIAARADADAAARAKQQQQEVEGEDKDEAAAGSATGAAKGHGGRGSNAGAAGTQMAKPPREPLQPPAHVMEALMEAQDPETGARLSRRQGGRRLQFGFEVLRLR